MRLDLECDDCGYLISWPGTDHTDWDALWEKAQKQGWDGAAQHTGRHTCPECGRRSNRSSERTAGVIMMR